MKKQNNIGDIVISFGQYGPIFQVATTRELSFADQPAPTKKSWGRFITALAISFGLFSLPTVSLAAPYTSNDIISATNTIRAEHHLSALRTNTALQNAAAAKAQDMFTQNYFSHYSPTGSAPWTFFKAANYAFTAAGENLAADYSDSTDIISAWLASASHRKNLLNGAYRDIGVAVADGVINGTPTTVVVQFFGSTSAATAPAPIVIKKTSPITPKPLSLPKVVKTASIPVQVPVSQPVLEPVVVSNDTPPQAAPISQPTAEVQGVETQVIPTLNLSQTTVTQPDPQVSVLILATLGLYVTILTSASLMTQMIKKTTSKTSGAFLPVIA